MRPFRSLLLCVLLTTSLGCSSLDPQIGPQVLYRDVEVRKPTLTLSEAPASAAPAPLSAMVHRFRLLQRVDDPESVEKALTQILTRRWAGDRVFLQTTVAGSAGAMGDHGRGEADLIVTGTIPHLFIAGPKGTTALALHVEIHDARTGKLLWSMDHAGSITAGFDQDYVLVRTRPRPPMDPVREITDELARDMGEILRRWNWAGSPPPSAGALHIVQEPTLTERVARWWNRDKKEEEH